MTSLFIPTNQAFSVEWMELDVGFTSACELHLDGHRTQKILRGRGDHEPIVIEHGTVSESSSAPFIFSPLVVTGEEKAPLLPAYLELIMEGD